MRVHSFKMFVAALAVLCCATAASADIKIKSRSTFGGGAGLAGQSGESTTYIKGKRQRSETAGSITSITQCDLRRSIQVYEQAKAYTVSPWDDADDNAAAQTAAASGPAGPARKGGVVTTTLTSTDTGERKQMFGYTARRIKTTMVTESSPDACQQTKSRMETDGWYIDLAVGFDCYDQAGGGYGVGRAGGCRDQYRTKQVGKARTGYPVMVTTTMYDENGQPSYTMTQEVLEISKATLDAALFDAPAGYREVRDASELYASQAATGAAGAEGQDGGASAGASSDLSGVGGMGGASGMSGVSGTNGAGSNGMQANTPGVGGALATGPKRPGMVRVGVAMTKATAAEGIDTNALAEAVRNTLVNHLRGPALEIVTLDARVPMQVEAEARQRECDYVVYTTAAHKKGGGGGFGGFLKKAAPVMDVVPVAGGTDAAVAASVATSVVYTAANFSGSVKSKDELTLEYTLQQNGSAVAANKLKAKAKSDGEDLISNLVEQVATAVITRASAK
jgi:hypothetical protein